jgi:hypothetical protein
MCRRVGVERLTFNAEPRTPNAEREYLRLKILILLAFVVPSEVVFASQRNFDPIVPNMVVRSLGY